MLAMGQQDFQENFPSWKTLRGKGWRTIDKGLHMFNGYANEAIIMFLLFLYRLWIFMKVGLSKKVSWNSKIIFWLELNGRISDVIKLVITKDLIKFLCLKFFERNQFFTWNVTDIVWEGRRNLLRKLSKLLASILGLRNEKTSQKNKINNCRSRNWL